MWGKPIVEAKPDTTCTFILDFVKAECVIPWKKFGTSCYQKFKEKLTWESAEKKCLSIGAHLASVNSLQEQTFLYSYTSDLAPNVYIGANDITKEGKFVWSDGSAFDFNFFHPGEPNDMWGEDCVHLHIPKSGHWNDIKCTTLFPFVCKKDKEGTS